MLETALELIGKRVIRIIVEALVFPESVDIRGDGPRPRAKSSKLADAFIADVRGDELAGQDIEIILGIGA